MSRLSRLNNSYFRVLLVLGGLATMVVASGAADFWG
jgi:hypothetical protein